MISNIKFIKEDINEPELNIKLKDLYKSKNLHIPFKDSVLLYYAKYLIEKNDFDYKAILEGNIDELKQLMYKEIKKMEIVNYKRLVDNLFENDIYKSLKYIAFQDYEISSFDDRVVSSFIDKSKRYLFISSGYLPYISNENVDILADNNVFRNGHFSTAIINYFIYDEILGIKRNIYKNEFNLENEEYDYYIYYNHGKYIDASEYFHQKKFVAKRVLSIYDYKDISNLNTLNRISPFLRNIKSIIIDSNKAYIIQDYNYNKDNSSPVNIKDLTYVDENKVKDILSSDKEIEDVSINILPDDIINHNLRLGISVYTNKKDNTNILDLIDKNIDLSKRINELNKKISNKIDELIVR